ncbi:MAG: hypothetical protein ACI8TP_001683 [Acidimicrobiales bacterium]|jgi:hypothetical protein
MHRVAPRSRKSDQKLPPHNLYGHRAEEPGGPNSGGDFDGATLMPEGLADVSGYPRLFEALRAHQWSSVDLEKVAADEPTRCQAG